MLCLMRASKWYLTCKVPTRDVKVDRKNLYIRLFVLSAMTSQLPWQQNVYSLLFVNTCSSATFSAMRHSEMEIFFKIIQLHFLEVHDLLHYNIVDQTKARFDHCLWVAQTHPRSVGSTPLQQAPGVPIPSCSVFRMYNTKSCNIVVENC